jgi:hypothetical protein
MDMNGTNDTPAFFEDTTGIRVDRGIITDLLVDIKPSAVQQALPDSGKMAWITPEAAVGIVQSMKENFLTKTMSRTVIKADQVVTEVFVWGALRILHSCEELNRLSLYSCLAIFNALCSSSLSSNGTTKVSWPN